MNSITCCGSMGVWRRGLLDIIMWLHSDFKFEVIQHGSREKGFVNVSKMEVKGINFVDSSA
jgi:hypothetical protein